MNLRPSGYEPDELPDCSTPHLRRRGILHEPDGGIYRDIKPHRLPCPVGRRVRVLNACRCPATRSVIVPVL